MKNIEKLWPFIVHLLFAGWSRICIVGTLIGFVAFVVTTQVPHINQPRYTIPSIIAIFIIAFIIKISKQYYIFYLDVGKKSRLVSIVEGKGSYEGKLLLIFDTNCVVDRYGLVTMYYDSCGARTPICLLIVLDINEQEIITQQYPSEVIDTISYANDSSKRSSTYILNKVDSVFMSEIIHRSNNG